MISFDKYDLREFAWASRGFGQAKCLALAARNRGDVFLARFFAKEARAEWQRLAPVLKQGGAL